MAPDFNKKTIDTVAKRAAFKCSNPDCLVSTVGPNSDPQKSTLIGEAAHIYGARPNSKRYKSNMTDATRAEITNSIWLCRNCHKLIDTDAEKYSSEVLFIWREQHEKYVNLKLGTPSEKIQVELQDSKLLLFDNYPSIIRRIVLDKPDGWEWRLTAELMRFFNRPLFQRIHDLDNGLYVKPIIHIRQDEVMSWISERLSETSILFDPIVKLIDELNTSWGKSGESGDEKEIHHICCLIRDYLEQIILHEEKIYFVCVPEEFERLIGLLKNLIGSQVKKLSKIPDYMDEAVSMIDLEQEGTIENPHIIRKTIEFNVPIGWEKQVNLELKKAKKYFNNEEDVSGYWLIFIFFVFIFWLFI
jgi:hypothetical protein